MVGTDADRQAVHAGDDGFCGTGERLQERDHFLAHRSAHGKGHEIGHVVSGRKTAVRAEKGGDADGIVGSGDRQRIGHLGIHVPRDGILFGRAVEADHLDAGIGFGPLDQNIIGHIHLLQSSHFQSSERDPGGGKAWPTRDNAVFQRCRFGQKVFGSKPAERNADIPAPVAGVGQPALGEIDACQGEAKQPLIGGGAGKRIGGLAFGKLCQKPFGRLFQIGDRIVKTAAGFPKTGQIGGAYIGGHGFQFGNEATHMRAIRERQLAGDEIDRLDAVGALIDRGDPGVAQIARGTRLLDKAHAAMDLNAHRGGIDANIGAEGFGRSA